MSFFDRQSIPESLLKPSKDIKDATRVIGLNEWETWSLMIVIATSRDGFEDDVAMLRDYCLITTNEGAHGFEMHRLVQLSTRKWLAAYGLQEKFNQQYIAKMAVSFPTVEYSNWATCQMLFAHVVLAVDYRPAKGRLEEAWATLLHNGGWYARSQGRYSLQNGCFVKQGGLMSRNWEDDATLASTSLFALVLLDKGLWEEAEKLNVQVIEISKIKLREDHPSTLTSMANLALHIKAGPVGGGQEARGAGDGDSQDKARGRPS